MKNTKDAEPKRGQKQKCKYCGQSHEFGKQKCPTYGKKCSKCAKMNHFAAVCKQSQKQVHMVHDVSSSDKSIMHIDHCRISENPWETAGCFTGTQPREDPDR